MELENGKISSFQLVFLITAFITGASVFLNPAALYANQDLWLAVIAGLGESVVFILIYIKLVKKFPGKSMIQISEAVYGRYFGKAVAAFYLLYLLSLSLMYLRTFADFFTIVIMPQTPMLIFLVMFIIVCGSAIRQGIEVICGCNFVIIVLVIAEILLTLLLLIPNVDLNNFLPIFSDLSLGKFIKATNIAATIQFGDIVVFLMIFASLNKVEQTGKSIRLALIIGIILQLIIVFRNTSVLGITAPLYNFPSHQAVRLINIKNIITRIDVINDIALQMLMFTKITVLYYAVVLGSAQLLRMRTYIPLVIPIGTLIITLSFIIFDAGGPHWRFGADIYPFYALPFQFGIPLLTLIIATIRDY